MISLEARCVLTSTESHLLVVGLMFAHLRSVFCVIQRQSSPSSNCQCPNDFSPSGSQCVCNGPKVVCSTGQCAAACPSDTPSKRSIAEQYRMGQVFCPHGQVPCGGATGPKSYECIDTRRTLDSCKWFPSLPFQVAESTGRRWLRPSAPWYKTKRP